MVPWIRRHLGRQILAGYGALCAVVMALGAYAFHSVHKVAQHIEHMGEDFSRSATLSMNIDHNLAMLRQYATGRIKGRHQADLSGIEQIHDLLKNQISKARAVLRARQDPTAVESLEKAAAQYGAVFGEIVQLGQKDQDLLLKDLNHYKYLGEDNLSALRVSLTSLHDRDALLLLESLTKSFLEVQVNGLRFSETSDEKDFVSGDKSHQRALEEATALRRRIRETEFQALDSAVESLESYWEIVGWIKNDAQLLNRKMVELLQLEDKIREGTSLMAKNVENLFYSYRRESENLSFRTGLAVALFAVLAILGAFVLAFLHTRRLINPLRRVMETSQQIAQRDLQCLITQLQRLARGELNVDFSVSTQPLNLQRLDEVGVTADAFDIIIQELHEAQGAFQAMSQYLRRTAATAQDVAAGNLDAAVLLASKDDALGKALDHMLESLRLADNEVAWHRQCLEEQVERRTAELQESRRMLWTLLSNLQGMAYRCRNDPHWSMEFVSEGALALTGYESDELTGNKRISYGELIHPDDRDIVWHTVQEALSERRPFILLYRIRSKADEEKWVWEKGRGVWADDGALIALEGFITDITVLKRLEEERERLIADLQHALSQVKTLSGLLPICSVCKKIRDDQGYWEQLESYFKKHSDILFSHGICPDCLKKLYPEIYERMQREKSKKSEK